MKLTFRVKEAFFLGWFGFVRFPEDTIHPGHFIIFFHHFIEVNKFLDS